MLWTFQELVGLLKEKEHESLSSISFTTLDRYISSHKKYIGRSKTPQVNCWCPVYENLELLLTSIKKNCDNIDIPTKCHDFLEKMACDPVTQTCVDKKCTSCRFLDMDLINDCEKLVVTHRKKEISIMKNFFVRSLVGKFTSCLNSKLTIYESTIIKNMYKMLLTKNKLQNFVEEK